MYSIAVTMMWTAEKRAELHNYRQLPDAQNISDKRMGKRERATFFLANDSPARTYDFCPLFSFAHIISYAVRNWAHGSDAVMTTNDASWPWMK